ncbi:helix-turn-helix transcriptional regulator [bacterium]|nr:helix-turn-helix transcriptional regulator [bacterium]
MAKTLGERVRQLRMAHSYSQRELAKLVGKSAGLISFIERDRNLPSYQIVRKLALVFETTTDYLINGDNPNNPMEDEFIDKLRYEISERMEMFQQTEIEKTELSKRISKLSKSDRYVLIHILDKLEQSKNT